MRTIYEDGFLLVDLDAIVSVSKMSRMLMQQGCGIAQYSLVIAYGEHSVEPEYPDESTRNLAFDNLCKALRKRDV